MIVESVKLLIPIGMTIFGVVQSFSYLRLRKKFDKLPVVKAEIVDSMLLNQLDPDGKEMVEAVIHFNYSFGGSDCSSSTPALRGFDLFPKLEYESYLVEKYKRGDIVDARVVASSNQKAFLEIAPLSKVSAIGAPFLIILGVLLFVCFQTGVLTEWFTSIQAELYYWAYDLEKS